jgi:aspartyl-tRNA(Asn)/glutamyl-tRNA(Gln) amidotransferase subunit C
MAAVVDRALVLHVAKLSSLSLSDGEADRLTADLVRIAAYVEQLESLDTTGVPPTAHVRLERMPLRGDVVAPCLPHEDALSQAPRAEQDGFAVPAFVE